MDDVVRPYRSHRSRNLLACAVLVTGLAGGSVFLSSGADAAPTPTSDITMTVRNSSGLLAGDSGSTFTVDSLSWGVPVSVPTTLGSNKVGAQTLSVSRPFGVGTTSLMTAAGAGRALSVEISVSRPGPTAPKLATYKLDNCQIVDVKQGGDANRAMTEQTSLSCATSTLTVTTQRADGGPGSAYVGKVTKS